MWPKLCCKGPKNMTAEVIPAPEPKSAALLVIGDEVLRGDVVDANTSWIARRLHCMGIHLRRVVVLPDNKTDIANEITAAVRRFSVVVSCGGVGPTPDDVTYEAAAAAFGTPLVEHPDLTPIIGVGSRMALVPKGCKLHEIPLVQPGTTLCKPIVQINKLFMLPGTPANVRAAFPHIEAIVYETAASELTDDNVNGGDRVVFHQRRLYLPVAETVVIKALEEAERRFGKSVTIGSYPKAPSPHSVSSTETELLLESTSEPTVNTALAFLKEHLHNHIPESTHMERLMEFVDREADESLANAVRDALNILRECQQRFAPDEVVLCVTGGKEATVLVHLWSTVLGPTVRPISLYVKQEDSFEEVDDFVDELASRYNLSLETVPGPLRSAVVTYIEERPRVKASLLGTRRTDPYSSSLSPFQETDSGWPPLTRVSPLLDWSYANVWNFLRGLGLPYCSLYDLGYSWTNLDQFLPISKVYFVRELENGYGYHAQESYDPPDGKDPSNASIPLLVNLPGCGIDNQFSCSGFFHTYKNTSLLFPCSVTDTETAAATEIEDEKKRTFVAVPRESLDAPSNPNTTAGYPPWLVSALPFAICIFVLVYIRARGLFRLADKANTSASLSARPSRRSLVAKTTEPRSFYKKKMLEIEEWRKQRQRIEQSEPDDATSLAATSIAAHTDESSLPSSSEDDDLAVVVGPGAGSCPTPPLASSPPPPPPPTPRQPVRVLKPVPEALLPRPRPLMRPPRYPLPPELPKLPPIRSISAAVDANAIYDIAMPASLPEPLTPERTPPRKSVLRK